jgi:alpha-L-rhamnosidase
LKLHELRGGRPLAGFGSCPARLRHPLLAIGLVLAPMLACPALGETLSRAPIAQRPAAESSLRAPIALSCDHRSAPLAVAAARPRLAWLLAQSRLSRRGVRQSAYRILVSSSLGNLTQGRGDAWDSGKTASRRTIDVPYGGAALRSDTRYFWKVRVWDADDRPSPWSAPAWWRTAPSPQDWKARWIADTPDSAPSSAPQPAPTAGAGRLSLDGRDEGNLRPMPVFRHPFQLHSEVAEAILHVSGLGQFEVHLNGAKVGNSQLTPGWTDYKKTVLYDTFDVTAMLRRGENVIGLLLGNGMYNVIGTPGRYTKFTGSYGQPKCFVQLEIRYADGSYASIVSDSTWRTTAGPIQFSSTYGGEDYDARKHMPGWDRPGFEAASWRRSFAVSGPGGQLRPEITPPIRVMHIYPAVSRKQLASGAAVYDLGQNFAGWPAITVQGRPGSTVRLIPGELLNSDGSVSQRSSGGPQWFAYTLAGRGREHWAPRFSFYGFRYVQVEASGPKGAFNEKPAVLTLMGEAVHSSARQTGSVETSDALLNRIHQLIVRAIENNMQSLLTDCPHREKLGWLEQTHLLGSALNFDFDLDTLYEQISRNLADAQSANGRVPEIAPQYTVFSPNYGVFDDSPEWGSAIVLDPWIIYLRYGDIANLRNHFGQMQGYVAYLGTRAQGHIVSYGLGDWYDIGPGEPGFSKLTSLGLTATAIYYQDIRVLEQAAAILDDNSRASQYAGLAAQVKQAFNARFYDAARHSYDRGSQTANSMPLAIGLAPEADRPAILANLVADIRAHQNHVTAGDIGYHYVIDALLQGDRSDVILDMLERRDAPSYGYQLSQGATALTEAWDADPASSQDHFMLGDAEEWYYRGLAGIGIDLDRDATAPIDIRPALPAGIEWTRGSYQSSLGTIRVASRRTAHGFQVDLTLPPNTTANVTLPAEDFHALRDGATPLDHSEGISDLRPESGFIHFQAASGTFHFSGPLPPDTSVQSAPKDGPLHAP